MNYKSRFLNFNYQYLFYLIVAIIIGFYCYHGALNNYFYADDGFWLADSKVATLNFFDTFDISKAHIRPLGFVPRIIYFLLLLSGKWRPAPFYLTIIILRIITSFLLFILVYRYIKKPAIALCVSLIFLVNFSTWEAAYWLVAMLYSIGLFFYALSLIIFLLDMENRNICKLICLFVSYLAAIFSHENAVTLPLVCFVAFLVYNSQEDVFFRVIFFNTIFNFLKRYNPFLLIGILYAALRGSEYGGQIISFSYYLKTAISIAKSSLTWFIPEHILYRVILLFNRVFHVNSTLDIQFNIYLLIISLLVAILLFSSSFRALFYFFIKKEKANVLLMLTGLLIMVLNIFPATSSPLYAGKFIPSRLLYYPSFGLSLVIAGMAVFYDNRIKRALFKYIFFISVVIYMIVAIIVNKKVESAFHYDTNIFKIVHKGLENKMPIFTSGSSIYVDLSSVKFKMGHSSIAQLSYVIPELLNSKPPFSKLPFTFEFTGQNIKNQLTQNLLKEYKPNPIFYFEVANDRLIMYRWSPINRNFILNDK